MRVAKTFCGDTLITEDYQAWLVSSRSLPAAKNVFVEEAKADSQYSETYTIDQDSITINVKILDRENRYYVESLVKNIFLPGRSGQLVITFEDGYDYYKNAVVQSFTPDPNYINLLHFILQTGESAWTRVTPDVDTWAADESGDTKVLSIADHMTETKLSIGITPTTLPETGWAYQNLYRLPNVPNYNYGKRPWCIQLDTAALITAGKMQADCDDLRIINKGISIPRWITNPNTDHTNIWFVINLADGYALSLLTGITISETPTKLYFAKNANTLNALKKLPDNLIIWHGTEWVECNGKDLKNYALVVSTRSAYGTTAQAHNSGDVFYWIENPIAYIYGNSAATDPSLNDADYDDEKPLFNLATSTNASWVYTSADKFYDPDHPNRTGGFTPVISKVGNVSDVYTVKGNAESGDPAMGILMGTWYKSGVAATEKATIYWLMQNAGKFATVSFTGRKYRSTAYWPGTTAIKLQRSDNLSTWYDVWTEAKPVAEDTWESITHSSVSITPNMKAIRFVMTGSLSAVADVECYAEGLTATAEFVSANLPTGASLGEKSNYLLDITIENQANGDKISLLFPMLIDTLLNLDGENYTVLYGDANARSALSLDDESREVWIRLQPGDNTLEITGNDLASLDIDLSYYQRRL